MACIQSAFQPLTVLGHGETKDPENQRDEGIALPLQPQPLGVRNRTLGDVEDVEQTDDADQRGAFEDSDDISFR